MIGMIRMTASSEELSSCIEFSNSDLPKSLSAGKEPLTGRIFNSLVFIGHSVTAGNLDVRLVISRAVSGLKPPRLITANKSNSQRHHLGCGFT